MKCLRLKCLIAWLTRKPHGCVYDDSRAIQRMVNAHHMLTGVGTYLIGRPTVLPPAYPSETARLAG